MQIKIFHLIVIGVLFIVSGIAYAQESNVSTCYEQKNIDCLEQIFADIMDETTPEKVDAIYALGLLYLNEKDYEAAKRQFEMGLMFGDTPRSANQLIELIKSGNVVVEAFDCLAIESEECLLNVVETNPDKADVAYYFLGGMLSKSDPERAAQYTVKAAELGHGTSECLLAFGYAHEKASGISSTAGFVPQLPKDYAKSRLWGEKCGHGPFVGYDKKFFDVYDGASNHKAFAKFGADYRIFQTGAATQEIAVSIAGELCNIGSKRKPSDEPCMIINVDGEWVDYYVAEPLPKRVGGVDDLLDARARDFYKQYEAAASPKVLVQGPLGNWDWQSGATDVSIEEVTRIALTECQKNWRYVRFGSVCKVISKNGEWVE